MAITTEAKRVQAGQFLRDRQAKLDQFKTRAAQIKAEVQAKKIELADDPDFDAADGAEANVIITNAQAIVDAY